MDSIRQDVVDALVWLDLHRCRELLAALLKGSDDAAQAAAERLMPELQGQVDVRAEPWREALLAELELRVSGADDDPDLVATTEVPNLVRFAADLRTKE